MLQKLFPLVVSGLLVCALQPAAFAGVVTVARAGGADFDQISGAIAWAAEGDTIWIRGGDYNGIEIIAKSLHLIADEGSRVTVDGLLIADLDEEQLVTIGGLGFWNGQELTFNQAAMTIRDCAGSVRLQDCRLNGGTSSPQGVPSLRSIGLDVLNSHDVDLTRCELYGGWGMSSVLRDDACLRLIGSRISLHDSRVEGLGGAWGTGFGAPGGTGAYMLDSTLLSVNSDIQGGLGGYADYGTPGDGGIGLFAAGTSQVHILGESHLHHPKGGGGGTCGGFACQEGWSGPDHIFGPHVSMSRSHFRYRSWQCKGLSFDSRSLGITVEGREGDQVYCLRSGATDFQLEPGGIRLTQAPALAGPYLGAIVNGKLEVEVPIAALGGLANEAVMLLQAFIITADGQLLWLAPTALTILDDARLEPFHRPIHVDVAAPDGGDGLSWATSYNDLGVAMEAARSSYLDDLALPRDLWLAGGRYVLEQPSQWESGLEFNVPGGLYGGFAGTEQSLEQRVLGAHPTVLDGDVLGDDGPGFANFDDNIARLARFWSVSPGAILVDQITFRGAHGLGNTRAIEGVGPVLFTDCTFKECMAESTALADGRSALSLRGSEFEPATVENSLFVDNYTSGWGAALRCEDEVRVVNCVFRGNAAPQGGGGAVVASGTGVTISGSFFEGNQAEQGGALYCGMGSETKSSIVGCTFVNNHASLEAGGLKGWSYSPSYSPDGLEVHNSILWGNSAAGLFNESAQITWAGLSQLPSFIEYSSVEGWTGALGGSGNHGLDPLLDAEGQLSAGSPCIDAGNNSAVLADFSDLDGDGDTAEPTPLDLARQPRFVDDPAVTDSGSGGAPVVDMGAFERQPGG